MAADVARGLSFPLRVAVLALVVAATIACGVSGMMGGWAGTACDVYLEQAYRSGSQAKEAALWLLVKCRIDRMVGAAFWTLELVLATALAWNLVLLAVESRFVRKRRGRRVISDE